MGTQVPCDQCFPSCHLYQLSLEPGRSPRHLDCFFPFSLSISFLPVCSSVPWDGSTLIPAPQRKHSSSFAQRKLEASNSSIHNQTWKIHLQIPAWSTSCFQVLSTARVNTIPLRPSSSNSSFLTLSDQELLSRGFLPP